MLLVTALDELAWLLNLRGSDVAHNPVFIGYALVTPDSATLYVEAAKVRHQIPHPLSLLATCMLASHAGTVRLAMQAHNPVSVVTQWQGSSSSSLWETGKALPHADSAGGLRVLRAM